MPSEIDGWLRRLATQEARCRALLGRLARAFLARRGQHELGFSRIDDYARERLGISGRELQSLATVVGRLAALPAIASAFEAGTLSWAQVRLLVGVATAETEHAWLELARGRTVRALAALIREAGRTPDADEDDEPQVRFRLRCSRRVRRLWHDVVELARRMAGAELSQGQAAEAIAAEGLSARPATGEAWPLLGCAAEPPPDSEKLLRHVEAEWHAQPRHRDPIFARDGWRCAVPACTSRRNLHDHHVLFRSHGGGNTRENRVTVCAWHHLRGIHAGRVRAWGEAPDGITWELGVRPGRPPLLRLEGDRYAAA